MSTSLAAQRKAVQTAQRASAHAHGSGPGAGTGGSTGGSRCGGSDGQHACGSWCHILMCKVMHASVAAIGTAAYFSRRGDHGAVEPPVAVPAVASAAGPSRATPLEAPTASKCQGRCALACSGRRGFGSMATRTRGGACCPLGAAFHNEVPCVCRDSFAATMLLRDAGVNGVRAAGRWLRSASDLSQSPAIAGGAAAALPAAIVAIVPAPLVWTAAASLFAVGAFDKLVDIRAEALLSRSARRDPAAEFAATLESNPQLAVANVLSIATATTRESASPAVLAPTTAALHEQQHSLASSPIAASFSPLFAGARSTTDSSTHVASSDADDATVEFAKMVAVALSGPAFGAAAKVASAGMQPAAAWAAAARASATRAAAV